MFENAALNTDMILTAKQAEILGSLVERDQVDDFVAIWSFFRTLSRAGERKRE